MNKFFHTFLDILFPPHCVHCDALLPTKSLFCSTCNALIQKIEPKERCPSCFSLAQKINAHKCIECNSDVNYFASIASVFDYEGPMKTIVKKMKYGNCPYLAKGCANFMVLELLSAKWEMPDFIVSVPASRITKFTRGYNQSYLIAKEMGKTLNIPAKEILKRSSSDYPRASLNNSQRKECLPGIKLKGKSNDFCDKTLLLVDDVMTTGATLRASAEALYELYPSKIYALTFCRS